MSRAARGGSEAPPGGGAAGRRAVLRAVALLAALAAAPCGPAPAAAAAPVPRNPAAAPAPADSAAAAAPFVPGPWRAPYDLPGAAARDGAAPAARSGDAAPPAAASPPGAAGAGARRGPDAGRGPGLPAAATAFDPIVPTRGVLMTPLFPGWGQLYAESGWRAVLAFGAETYYWSQLLKYDRKAARLRRVTDGLPADSSLRPFYELQAEEYREQVRDYAWWSLGALLIIALDAYVDAHLHDFGRDPVPVPDRWDGDGGGAAGERAAAATAAAAEAEAAAALAAPDPIAGTVLLAWRTSF